MSRSPIIIPKNPDSYIPLSKRTGKLTFTLTNDYVFRTVLQQDRRILHALLCSLLGFDSSDIRSADITNPIQLGSVTDAKDTVLDVKLLLNSDRVINLEMQVRDQKDWPERSLTYLCRSFDNLKTGDDYTKVLSTHHIGILNFSLPRQRKQFYSHYYITNEETQERFSDKFRLSVLDLTQTALATDYDRQCGLDLWAAAFNAATWEEFKMLSEKDPLYEKVAEAVYIYTTHKELADQIRRKNELEAERAREQAERAKEQEELAMLKKALAQKDAENAALLAELERQKLH